MTARSKGAGPPTLGGSRAMKGPRPQPVPDPFAMLDSDLGDDRRSIRDLQRLASPPDGGERTPYPALIRALVAQDHDDPAAEDLWRRILAHKGTLEKRLGRPVHVKVAAIDLLEEHSPAGSSLWPGAGTCTTTSPTIPTRRG